jgi:hypothetical protein
MNILSYVGIEGLPFGSHTSEATAMLGQPLGRGERRDGALELEYPGIIIRFDKQEHRFIEVTAIPCNNATLTINDIPLTWNDDFLKTMCVKDGDPMTSVGFVFLFRLGMMLSGFSPIEPEQFGVTLFCRQDLEYVRKTATPFVLGSPLRNPTA